MQPQAGVRHQSWKYCDNITLLTELLGLDGAMKVTEVREGAVASDIYDGVVGVALRSPIATQGI